MKKQRDLSFWKSFMIPLAATTVSIVLTFGTTAIIDRKKQNAEKREMVMMIMYDLRESLKAIQQCDEELTAFFDTQLNVVAHPRQFDGNFATLALHIPILDYTTTTEHIFNSNIETIQTIGNILFVETVSSFYSLRSQYKSGVVSEFQQKAYKACQDYEELAGFDSSPYLFYSHALLHQLKGDYEQCKLMMKVTENELDEFTAEKEKYEEAANANPVIEGTKQDGRDLQEMKEKLWQAQREGRKELQNTGNK